jgi:hypothetical protein
VVDAGQPKGGASGYRLDASAAGAALDVLGVFSVGTSSDAATYHRRVLPGLTLQASPSSLRRGRTTTVTFTVLDAGDPVQGAKVTAGGRSATTTAGGKATLKLTGTGRNVSATATKTGYSRQTRRLKAEG